MSNLALIIWVAGLSWYTAGLIYFGWEFGVLIGKKTGAQRFSDIVNTAFWPVHFIIRVYREIRKLKGKDSDKVVGLILALTLANGPLYAQYGSYKEYLLDGGRWLVPVIGLIGFVVAFIYGVLQYKSGTFTKDENGKVTDGKGGFFGQKNIGFTIAFLLALGLIVYYFASKAEM